MARTKGAVDKSPRKNARSKIADAGGVGARPRGRPRSTPATQRAQVVADGVKTNGVNEELLKKTILDYEAEDEICASIMGAAMNNCKVHRQKQKDILERARSGNIPIRALKADLKIRKHEKSIVKIHAGLETDDQALHNQIRDITRKKIGVLVGTPFGDFATSDAEIARQAADTKMRTDALGILNSAGDSVSANEDQGDEDE